MREKDMVNDVLSMVNSSLTGYANVISQTSDQQLRQTIQQIRNSDEQFQYDLYKLAEKKGFYQPAQQADPKDIQQIKTQLSGETTGRNAMGGVGKTGAETGDRSRMDW